MNDVETLKDLTDYAFDGERVLEEIIKSSSYKTPSQALASLTKSSHPQTVAQTNNENLFRVVRLFTERGNAHSSGEAMCDDNTSPRDAFLWANQLKIKDRSYLQFNHIWSRSQDIKIYTSLANICITPSFLAKLTDGTRSSASLLRYRAFELYVGFKPSDVPNPDKAEGYDDLVWAETLPPQENVEKNLRNAMKTKPCHCAVKSVYQFGWYFSNFKPETTITATKR